MKDPYRAAENFGDGEKTDGTDLQPAPGEAAAEEDADGAETNRFVRLINALRSFFEKIFCRK